MGPPADKQLAPAPAAQATPEPAPATKPTRKCAAPVLAAAELDALCGNVFASWVLSADRKSVSKRIVAKNWAAALAFINKVSDAAEEASHHPDVHLTNWRHVDVVLTTHATGGLSRLDASLAAEIDAIDVEVSPKWLRDTAALEAAEAPAEAPVAWDDAHYVNGGLNGDFAVAEGQSAEDLVAKFAGGADGGGGLFENSETRDIARAKHHIVAALVAHAGVGAGSAVADVGCGTGLLLADLSETVGPSGAVVASEPAPAFRALAAARAARLPNVAVVDAPSATDPGLGDGAVDCALLVDVYHHFEYPRTMLRTLRRALRPRGTLCVVDFHKDVARVKSKTPDWVARHLRADQATFRAEIEACGFTHIAEPFVEDLPENYLMVFRKTPLARVGDGWGQRAKRPRDDAH